ncbi:acyltransferase [Streptomyces sp. NPDC054784]
MALPGRRSDRGKEPPPRTFTVRSGTTGDRMRLNALDMITGGLYVDRAFFYRETLDGAALRESLAATMRHYQPLSGRLEEDPDGGWSVLLNDRGAVFEERDSALTLDAHAYGRPGRPELKELLPPVPLLKAVGDDVPAMAVRLTHTAGGGGILAVRIKHALVDAGAFTTFLEHWSREHRGLSYPAPCLDRELLDEHAAKAPPEAGERSARFRVPTRRSRAVLLTRIAWNGHHGSTVVSRLSAAETRAMKDAAAADLAGTDRWVSTNDAVTAHVWKTLAELRNRPAEAPETLGLIARFTSPAPGVTLPDDYWGNTITSSPPSMTADALRTRPLGEIALTVRDSLASITGEQVRSESAYLLAQRAAGRHKRVMPHMPFGAFSDVVQLNNLSRLPTYDIDFGDGGPIWCELPDMVIPWMVHIMGTPEAEESLDVHVSMPDSAAELFRGAAWQRRLHAYAPEEAADGA